MSRAGRRGRRLALAGASVLAAFVALCPFDGVAVAEMPAAATYWMRTNPSGDSPVVFHNPMVPPGGLYVQQDPSSSVTTPTAYAGIRFVVREGSRGVLTLKLTQAASPGAAVSACAITSPWQQQSGEGPAPYDQAPAFDTHRCAPG